MGKPSKSYNDLELVEGDIEDNNDSNEQNNMPLDPRAGNVNVEIPRIKFNAKDVSKLLNKYVTEVDCTRKCLIELTKLIKWYNRLGEGILPYKPKDLKLNSQVLKKKKKKQLSKMIKEGVKKLEIVDSKIKKNSRDIIEDCKSLKKLDKMGEIIVEHGKIGKSIWKVRKFDKSNVLKENFNLNESWTVSDETKHVDDENKTVCETVDNEPPILVPAGFSVEVIKTSEQTPSQIEVQTLTSLKSLMNDHSPNNNKSNKFISPKLNITNQSHNTLDTSLNNSCSVSDNKDGSTSKEVKKSKESTEVEICILPSTIILDNSKENENINTSNVQKTTESLTSNNEIEETIQLKITSPKTDNKYIMTNKKSSPYDNFVLSKIKRHSNEIFMNSSPNGSWSVCSDEKLNLNEPKSPKSNITDDLKTLKNPNHEENVFPFKICSPNININISCLNQSSPNDGCASNKMKQNKKSIKVEKRDSLSDVITPDKNSKSPKSPTPEQRVLRRRTIIIPKKKPEAQNEGTPKRKVKNSLESKVLQKRRKTIAGEEISMLKPEEISNKALEKVVS